MLILRYYHFFVLFNWFFTLYFSWTKLLSNTQAVSYTEFNIYSWGKKNKPKIAVKISSHEFCVDLQF